MSRNRIRGQEVTMQIITDGQLEDEFQETSDVGLEPKFSITSVGFMGETSERKDELFTGFGWSLTMQIHSARYFEFVDLVKRRAQRLDPNRVFSLTGTFVLPSGQIVNATLPDIKFSGLPVKIGSRADYAIVSMAGEAEDWVKSTQ